MNILIFLLTTLFAVFTPTAAYISLTEEVTCQTQVINGASQRICSTYTNFGPAIVLFPNETVGYVGPYGYDFNFWKGLAKGTRTSTLTDAQRERHLLGYTVGVSWENGACQVKVSDTQCNSCSICSDGIVGQETVLSADCTNIERGRNVTCESAFIFFPLKKSMRYRNDIGKKPSPNKMSGSMSKQMRK